MSRFTKRLSSRRALSAIIAAGVLAASAIVVTTTTLAQNRPERGGNSGGNGFDRRDRGNGNTGNNGYGNERQRTGSDRQNFDRQNFDRSRQFNNNSGSPTGGRPTYGSAQPTVQPADSSAASQPATDAAATAAAIPIPSAPRVRLKPSDYSTKYVLLEQKNIFNKSRLPPPDPTRPPRVVVGDTRRPEDLLVLRGIALQEGRRVAFVESMSSNTTSRLTPGSSILSGKIVEVGGDYITYEVDGGRQTRIEIAHNFAGTVATGGYAPSYGGSSSGGSFTVSGSASASSGAAPPDPNNPGLSIEERMKARRAQEQQPKPQ